MAIYLSAHQHNTILISIDSTDNRNLLFYYLYGPITLNFNAITLHTTLPTIKHESVKNIAIYNHYASLDRFQAHDSSPDPTPRWMSGPSGAH